MNKGSQFETELFGCCAEYMKNVVNDLSFPEALEYARRCQKILYEWNPARPKTAFSKQLFDEVRLLLPDCDKKKLCLVVAVGTCLDFRHQVDAFFEIKGTNRIATLDAKTGKKARTSAHIVLRRRDLHGGEVLKSKALEIVRRLDGEDERLPDVAPNVKVSRLIRKKAIREKLHAARNRAIARYKQASEQKSMPVPLPPKKLRCGTGRVVIYHHSSRRKKRPRDPVEDQRRIENLKRVLGL